jgi:putative endonuclease
VTNVRRVVGDAGEEAVARWYARAGFEVLARNWRVREGELDLVARRADTIVFCEVKTRRGDAYGQPFEAVTARKQARIRGLAMQWLAAAGEHADVLRFDVASVRPDGRGDWLIEMIEAAF